MTVYRCSHLLTPAGIAAGAVAVRDGVIVAAGPFREVLRECGGADARDLGDAIIMPGLVNAHTHLELSFMGDDRPPGGNYLDWLEGLPLSWTLWGGTFVCVSGLAVLWLSTRIGDRHGFPHTDTPRILLQRSAICGDETTSGSRGPDGSEAVLQQ